MTLSPVSTAGSVETTVLSRRDTDGSSETSVLTVGNIDLESFIWHPWFARMSGDVSVGYDKTFGDLDAGSALRASATGTLDILPRSKYPATLSFAHVDSRVSGDFSGSDFTRDRVGLTARAAITQSLKSTVRASWDRTDRTESGVRTGLRGGFDLTKTFSNDEAFLGIERVNMGLDYRQSDFRANDPDEEDRSLDRATFRFDTQSEPLDNLRIDSRFTGTYTDLLDEDDAETRLTTQGVSTLQWRPDDLPFSVTGALRTLFEDITEDDGGRTRGSTTVLASGSLGLRWPVTDHLSVNSGIRASYEDVARDEGIDLGETGDETGRRFESGILFGITYLSERHDLAGFDWRWDGRLQTDTGFDSEAGLDARDFAQLGHSLEREVDGIFFWPVRITLSQEADVRIDTEDEDSLFTAGLSHALQLSYNASDRNSSSFGRFFLRDNHGLVGDGREFQNAQVQFGHRLSVDRDTRFQGNLNAQGSRSVDEDGETDEFFSLSAEMIYEQRELFGVLNLGFRSTLRANILDAKELFGGADDELTESEALRNDWRNVLTYRIGRLIAQAEATAFHEDEGLGYLVLLRLRREFGGQL